MFNNSMAPPRNPDYGKLEEHDVAADLKMHFPSKRSHTHKKFFVQPTTHTADRIPRKPDHKKLEEDGDDNVDADDAMKHPAQWLLKHTKDYMTPTILATIHEMKDDERQLPVLQRWASYASYDGNTKREVDRPNLFYLSREDRAKMFPNVLPPNGGKCRICLKEAHIKSGCPYEYLCPIGAQIGNSYYIACKQCGHPVNDKPLDESSSYCCGLQELQARVKVCFNCSALGAHRTEDCPEETRKIIDPWF